MYQMDEVGYKPTGWTTKLQAYISKLVGGWHCTDHTVCCASGSEKAVCLPCRGRCEPCGLLSNPQRIRVMRGTMHPLGTAFRHLRYVHSTSTKRYLPAPFLRHCTRVTPPHRLFLGSRGLPRGLRCDIVIGKDSRVTGLLHLYARHPLCGGYGGCVFHTAGRQRVIVRVGIEPT